MAARYNIVTAGREWVTVVASGVAAGRAGSRKSGRSRPTFGCIRTRRGEVARESHVPKDEVRRTPFFQSFLPRLLRSDAVGQHIEQRSGTPNYGDSAFNVARERFERFTAMFLLSALSP